MIIENPDTEVAIIIEYLYNLGLKHHDNEANHHMWMQNKVGFYQLNLSESTCNNHNT